MEMEGEARLQAPRQVVWDALNDPEVLKASIPGCEEMVRESATAYSAVVVSRVGPIKARFTGKVTLSDVVPPVSYVLTGEGQGGAAGFARADIGVRLDALEENVTLIRYGVKATVGGKLAQLGARMIDATARKNADDFFDQFARAVGQGARPAGAANEMPAVDLAILAGSPGGLALAPPPAAVAALATGEAASPGPGAEPAVTATDAGDGVDVLVSKLIKVWIADQIAVVTLNRPKQRNALTLAMWKAMPRIIGALDRNPDVRAILLTGAEGDFSVGADISEFESVRANEAQSAAYEVAVDACCGAIANASKPTIAVIRGYCLGGAMHVAMSCDFRHAAEGAQFGIPSARLSIVYGVSGTQRLLALVGLSSARKILYGGARFGAEEAHRIGLIDEIARVRTPALSWWQRLLRATVRSVGGDPMVGAREQAALMAANAPLSILGAKTILNGLASGPGALDSARVRALIIAASASRDYAEGRAAFREKREPRFTGC